MEPRSHFNAPRWNASLQIRIDPGPESPSGVCLLLDLESATADAVADVIETADHLRVIRTTRAALFAGDDVHRCGCVVAVPDEDRGAAWSLPRALYEHPSPLGVVF